MSRPSTAETSSEAREDAPLVLRRPGRSEDESGRAPYRPLRYTPIPREGSGAKRTDTEATRLVGELLEWAAQFEHEEGRELWRGLNDVRGLFLTVWTEIDESLLRFRALAGLDAKQAEQQREEAMRMLHRWQDRGGRVGNVR